MLKLLPLILATPLNNYPDEEAEWQDGGEDRRADLGGQREGLLLRRGGAAPLGRGKDPGMCSTVLLSLISIGVSVLQFSATVEHSEKCTTSSQFEFQYSILRCSKWGITALLICTSICKLKY